MGMQDWLLIAGGVILLAVIADLIRRFLQRDKLRLKIDKQFQDLPDLDPTCSELPNGGARVVSDLDGQLDWGPADSPATGNNEPRHIEPTFDERAPESVAADMAAEPITDPVEAESEPVLKSVTEEEWQIDPILTGERSSAEQEVDLLMEKEFRGVGEGAHQWLDSNQPVSEPPVTESPFEPHSALQSEPELESIAEPAVEPLSDRPQPHVEALEPSNNPAELIPPIAESEWQSDQPRMEAKAQTDVAKQVTVDEIEPQAQPEPEPEPEQELAQRPGQEPPVMQTAEPEPTNSEPQHTQPALSAVETGLNLERPVHELLQEQQASRKQEPQLGDLDSLLTEPPGPEPEVVEPAPRKPAATRTRKRKRKARPEEQTSFFDLLPDLAPEPDPPAPKPKTRRRRKAKAAEPVMEAPAVTEDTAAQEDEVLVINVDAREQPFAGPILFKLLGACGMEHGEMEIFHRHEQSKGRGAIQFSTANAVAPGTFDPAGSEQFSTPAVTFFMRMSEPADRMNAFECMLATAQCVADNLGGELKDENRSSLRSQTIEHYRQKVREFERKQLTRRV